MNCIAILKFNQHSISDAEVQKLKLFSSQQYIGLF